MVNSRFRGAPHPSGLPPNVPLGAGSDAGALPSAPSIGVGSGSGALPSAIWTDGASPALLGQLNLRPYSDISIKALPFWLNSQKPKFSKTQDSSLLIAALAPNNPSTSTSVMESLSIVKSDTGE